MPTLSLCQGQFQWLTPRMATETARLLKNIAACHVKPDTPPTARHGESWNVMRGLAMTCWRGLIDRGVDLAAAPLRVRGVDIAAAPLRVRGVDLAAAPLRVGSVQSLFCV